MNCPSCGTPNDSGNRFCLRCGNPIPVQSAPPPAQAPQAFSSQPQQAGPVRSMRPIGAPPAQPPVTPPPAPQVPSGGVPSTIRVPDNYQTPPVDNSFSQQPQYPQQYAQQYPQQQYPQHQYPNPSSSQISTSTLNIWGPFAGYGTRRRHVGWLMDNQAARYEDLLKRVSQRLKERQIPNTDVAWRILTARGIIVESRPYFIIQRGLVSLGLNIGAVGKDLFISMATYLKPPISNFRVLVAGLSALLFGLGGPVIGGMINAAVSSMQASFSLFGSTNSGPDMSFLLLPTLCCLGPLWTLNGILFPIALVYSAYKWLTEKDFFALLRVAPNEFNEDDLMSLEKAVEQTIRSGLDDIGLNPAELKPTAVQGSEIRLI